MPIRDYLAALKITPAKRILYVPSLFWLGAEDWLISALAYSGVLLSFLLLFGILPSVMLFLLWVYYLSFVCVGQEFLSYQWDALLLETGAMAFFFSLKTPPPGLFIASFWVFIFRFMFSSGLVKLTSGDVTWRNLSALSYHYETQPLPNALAWHMHQFGKTFQKFSAFLTFAMELGVPFLALAFFPAPRLIGFLLLSGFQLIIFLTGNFAFFNVLTIVLCLPLLSDVSFSLPGSAMDCFLDSVAIFYILLNAAQLLKLFFRRSFAARLARVMGVWHLSNSYGLFAVMTTHRFEFVVEGSRDGSTWATYEFRFKPGDPSERPRQVAPHQPRLDWQMWFAALQPHRTPFWLQIFGARLLEGSADVLALLKTNPFADHPPTRLRISVYTYHFSGRDEKKASGLWWIRKLEGVMLH